MNAATPGQAAHQAETVAIAFHQAYEDLAPQYGYRTRGASAKPWDEVPEQNASLMVATAARLLETGVISVPQDAGPAPELAAEGTPPDVRPRSDGRRGLDITCGKCGEDYGTNVPDVDEIECPECEARRCPHCLTWYGGNS